MQLAGRIFLTGGTGSLGTALLQRAEREGWDCRFSVFSRDEVKQGEMRGKYPKHRFVLGNVTDRDWLALQMAGHDMVIHAAAYKQVPAAEVNASEAIRANVVGSLNVAFAAVQNGIPRVIGISTDKACMPQTLYGETKACMEKMFQQACMWGKTRFNLCRYGNVLGSRGSVLPLFQRQVAEGKPITLTMGDMTRFWLTLDEAVDLVLRTAAEQEPGTIIVPEAPASTMYALAEAVGGVGYPAREIGIRPGEKLHEHLIHGGESMHTTPIIANGGWRGFRVFPAYTGLLGGLEAGYAYSSDIARHLSHDELRAMVKYAAEAHA